MEALETGVDADAFFVEEDAEESDIETELDVDESGAHACQVHSNLSPEQR